MLRLRKDQPSLRESVLPEEVLRLSIQRAKPCELLRRSIWAPGVNHEAARYLAKNEEDS